MTAKKATKKGVKTNPRSPAGASHRPGTAVGEKGRQSAAAVLDAASSLLAEEGAAGLSTRKIAARAGMHAGNAQYYFRTKRDLVRALLERYLDQSRERVSTRMTSSKETTPEERLRSGIEEILADQSSAADCAMFRELWALAAHDREIADVVDGFYTRYVEAMAAMLRGIEPRLSAARASRSALLVVALLEGLSIVAEPASGNASRRRLATQIGNLALILARA